MKYNNKFLKHKSELTGILDGHYEIKPMPSYRSIKSINADPNFDFYYQFRLISLIESSEHEATEKLKDLLKNHGYECKTEATIKDINRVFDMIASKDGIKFIFWINIESKNRKNFKRLKQKRVDKVIMSLRSLSKLKDRSNYNYTDSDIREIEATLLGEVHQAILSFKLSSNKENKGVIKSKSDLGDYHLKKVESLIKEQEKSQKELIQLSEELRRTINNMHTEDN